VSSQLGQLVCFDEARRQPIDWNLDWSDVKQGKHENCGNPVAIEDNVFNTYDIKSQQRICDQGIQWKFYSTTDAAFSLKRLSRPWAEGETIRLIKGQADSRGE